jgi:hypothetical protein
MRNMDSRIRSFGLKSCPLFADQQHVGEFCNTIRAKRTFSEPRLPNRIYEYTPYLITLCPLQPRSPL